jgi:hypothetical protein
MLEIILASLSFIFNKLMKFIIGNLYIIYLYFAQKKSQIWRIFSESTLNNSLSMPVLMTKAPRWNTHAIIGTLGPIKVTKNLALDLNAMQQSTEVFIGAIYSFPSYKTIATINLDTGKIVDNWLTYELPAGKYTLGLRYYNTSHDVVFPTVKIDATKIIDPESIPANVNNFYHQLINKKNWFYLALHYYIYTILIYQKYLPASFVRYEFLPVGAPNTEFYYNNLPKNYSLEININSETLSNYDVYFTLYDRSSLPIDWCHIKDTSYQINSIDNDGYYLLRVRQKEKKLAIKFNLDRQELRQKLKIVS